MSSRRTASSGGRVAVVVVTYDPPSGMLERCVEGVAGTLTDDVDALLVVDTGGRARERLAGASIDRLEVIDAGRNVGFGAALSIGFRRALAAGADVLVGVNDDVEPDPGWLQPLVTRLAADDELGAVQPLLLRLGAAGDVVDSAGVEIDRYGAGSDRLRGRPGEQAVSVPLEAVTGGAAAWSARFVDDVGLPDPRFFLYYEDVEWCRRGAAAGWRFELVADSTVRHAGSASSSSLGDAVRLLQERNRIWSSAMHGSAGEFARGLALSARRLRHEPRGVHVHALVLGLVGAVPRLVDRAFGRRRRWMVDDRSGLGPPRAIRSALGAGS